MKTHRPWQPHMSNTPLFNPYTPAGHATTLDHFDPTDTAQPTPWLGVIRYFSPVARLL